MIFPMDEKRNLNEPAELRRWYDDYFAANQTWPTSREYALRLLAWLRAPVVRGRALRLLDLACGGGYFLATAQRHAECWGVDFSAVALSEARSRSSARMAVSVAEALPFPDGYFDALTCLGSFEHFSDRDRAAAEMLRITAPQARYLVLVPINPAWLTHDIQPLEVVGTSQEWSDYFTNQGFIIESQFKTDKDPDLAAFSGGCVGLVMMRKI